jgi:type II secretory pathway component PulJ
MRRSGNRASRRAGKSLIEMLMLMGILSVIISTVAMMLVALMKTDRQIRRDLEQQTSLARLADKFRADAHAAKSCEVGAACDLKVPDGRVIRYAAQERQIAREVRRGNAVEHHDAFLLPANARVEFALPSGASGRLVHLEIVAVRASDHAYQTPIRPTLIEAVIGATHLPVNKETQP